MGIKDNILTTFHQKDELAPQIWEMDSDSGEFFMREEVRTQLLKITNEFLSFIDLDNLDCSVETQDCDIEDIVVTGSISNYNWSSFSDIDLHIILNFSEIDENEKLIKNFLNAKKNLWNASHDIEIRGFEVEVYGQDSKETHFSSGVYSILFNEWVVKPQYVESEIDVNKILSKARGWMDMIDALYSRQYEQTPEETLEVIDKIKNKLKKFRNCGLEEGGEYSYENLAFKFLRRSGYIKRLFQLKNELIDNSLSMN
tara:strand:- start:1009 stop:1776 length:768 start_codon:yes stop_codon:yes gene_type:complete